MKYVNLLGRVLYSVIFLVSAPRHFTGADLAYAAHAGVPMPQVLVPLSGAIALLGALSILLGYKARVGAWLIVLFLVPVTLTMHRFWGLQDPMMQMMQTVNFLKNLSMLGAALMIAQFGSGPLSLRP